MEGIWKGCGRAVAALRVENEPAAVARAAAASSHNPYLRTGILANGSHTDRDRGRRRAIAGAAFDFRIGDGLAIPDHGALCMECTVDEDLVADGTWIFTQQECERIAFFPTSHLAGHSMRRIHLEGMSVTADSWMQCKRVNHELRKYSQAFLSEVPLFVNIRIIRGSGFLRCDYS
jgi:hypothetical protein